MLRGYIEGLTAFAESLVSFFPSYRVTSDISPRLDSTDTTEAAQISKCMSEKSLFTLLSLMCIEVLNNAWPFRIDYSIGC